MYITLKRVTYYDVFKELKISLDAETEIGSDIANNIIIPKNESSIEEDYENGLLDKDGYIDVLISKGFIKEIV